jgi:hypothetical protein
MPQRTNEFQQLVALIERALAPIGAKVTESAMAHGMREEDRREIDILIESNIGPYAIKVAVEAKDESRKMDIVRFESIIGKYAVGSGLRVDKVIVVCRAGFSKQVVRRAAVENIELLTLKAALESDWTRKGKQPLVFRMPPSLASIRFDPPVNPLDPMIVARDGRVSCTKCGRDHGTPLEWAQKILHDGDRALELQVTASRSGHFATMHSKWSLPNHKLTVNGQTLAVREVTAEFLCALGRSTVEAKSYEHGGQLVHHFSGTAAGQKVEWVMPDGDHPHQIAVRISNAVPAGPVNENSPKSEEAPTRRLIAPPPTDLTSRLERIFCNIDAVIEPNAIIHDFARGQDRDADLLLRLYFMEGFRTRTAIIVNRTKIPISLEFLRDWEQAIPTTDLDLVVVFSDCGFEQTTANFQSHFVRVHSGPWPDDVELLKLITPPMAACYGRLLTLHAEIFSAANSSFAGTAEPVFRIGDRQLPYKQVVDAIILRALEGFMGTFLDPCRIVQRNSQHELRFAFGLPRNVELVASDGRTKPIVHVSGNATMAATFVIFDTVQPGQIDDCNRNALVFLSADPKYPLLFSCYKPRPTKLELSGAALDSPMIVLNDSLPERIFQNLFGPTSEADNRVNSTSRYKAGDFKICPHEHTFPWSFKIVSLNKLRCTNNPPSRA